MRWMGSRDWRRWGCVWVALLALVLVLAACGRAAGTPPSGTPVSCVTPSSSPASTAVGTGVATPAGTVSAGTPTQGGGTPTTPTPVPVLSPVPSATAAAGRLTVSPDRGHYGPCEVIRALVANGFEANIYVTDHHTSCGILTLERQVNDDWKAEGYCPLGSVTRLLEIRSGTVVEQRLGPGGNLSPMSWPAGTYRLSLAYATGSADHQVPQAPITSATFTIG